MILHFRSCVLYQHSTSCYFSAMSAYRTLWCNANCNVGISKFHSYVLLTYLVAFHPRPLKICMLKLVWMDHQSMVEVVEAVVALVTYRVPRISGFRIFFIFCQFFWHIWWFFKVEYASVGKIIKDAEKNWQNMKKILVDVQFLPQWLK